MLLLLQPNFNSIKVQLELSGLQREYYDTLFQFHKGTIRTKVLLIKTSEAFNFNSIKVQLELYRCPAGMLTIG